MKNSNFEEKSVFNLSFIKLALYMATFNNMKIRVVQMYRQAWPRFTFCDYVNTM